MYWGVMGGQMGWGLIEEEGWRKGPWTTEEDRLLIDYVRVHGEGRWNSVARLAGLKRNGKSCRLRWVNYLRPDLKRGQITPHEESIILELHARWGNRWSTIARSLPGRTDNEIKNYWRTHFKKKQAKASPESSSSEKAKARLLKKQQFQQQQQQQQQQYLQHQHQQQQQEFDKVDLKRIAALLLDQETEQQQPAVGPTQQPPYDQQGLLYSMLANEANNNNNGLASYYWPDHHYDHHQASGNCDHVGIGEEYQANVWDWNLEDFHGSNSFGSACSTTTAKSAMHNLVLPFC